MRTWGGIAAVVEAATYLIGFAMIATVLVPLAGDLDAAGFFASLAERQGLLFVWNLLICVLNGAFLVLLVLAMHERRAAAPPAADVGRVRLRADLGRLRDRGRAHRGRPASTPAARGCRGPVLGEQHDQAGRQHPERDG
jgi:hypothetical protein